MKKYWLAAVSVIMLVAVAAISFWATDVLKRTQNKEVLQEQAYTVVEESVFGIDGKPIGSELDRTPKQILEDYVILNDRVLERYHYDANSIRKGSEILSAAMNSLPEGVNKYLMLIPLRISLENEEFKRYSDDVIGAIEEIYASMPSDVITLDAAGSLLEHKDEYLYFRTDHVWTALGAYYAVKEFSRKAGIDMIGIEEYWKSRFDYYVGTMYVLPGTESLNDYPDYVKYFILKDATNEQTITSRRGKEYFTYNSPAVAVSRRGYDIFIGKYYSHSIIQGEATNKKTLMMLGDEYSKAFAPWLTPYYQQIVLVSPTFFSGGSKEFWQLFSQYQITDFLIIEYGMNMGDSNINAKLRELMFKP